MTTIFTTMLTLTLPLSFVTNWSWAIGIKPFSFNVIGGNFSDYKLDEKDFMKKGYYNIAKYIEEEFKNQRVIVSGNEERFKAAVEIYKAVSNPAWSPSYITDNYEHFKEYVCYAGIEGFLLFNDDTSSFRDYVFRLVEEFGCENVIEDTNAVFYVVHSNSSSNSS